MAEGKDIYIYVFMKREAYVFMKREAERRVRFFRNVRLPIKSLSISAYPSVIYIYIHVNHISHLYYHTLYIYKSI